MEIFECIDGDNLYMFMPSTTNVDLRAFPPSWTGMELLVHVKYCSRNDPEEQIR